MCDERTPGGEGESSSVGGELAKGREVGGDVEGVEREDASPDGVEEIVVGEGEDEIHRGLDVVVDDEHEWGGGFRAIVLDASLLFAHDKSESHTTFFSSTTLHAPLPLLVIPPRGLFGPALTRSQTGAHSSTPGRPGLLP